MRLNLTHNYARRATNFVMDVTGYTGSSGYVKDFNFGAAYTANNEKGYRGWMDEIRITRRALKPSEFLSTRGVPEVAQVGGKQVLFFAPFETDMAAYPFPADVVGAVTKGGLDTVNRPMETIAARADMGLPTANAASFAANAGYVTYDNVPALSGYKSLTIEFYASVPEAGDNTPLVRYEGERVGFEVAKSSEGQVSVRLRTDKMSVGSYIRFDSTKMKRPAWHHYAVTLERKVVADEVVTEVRAYVDHVELALATDQATNQFPGEIPAHLTGMKLYVGRARTWGSLTGAIDEVRITEGVLGVENFLDARPKYGVLLYVR